MPTIFISLLMILHTSPRDSIRATDYLILPDAISILGQPASLAENTTVTDKDAMQYKCTYTGAKPDPASGKASNLFFTLEKYKTPASAHQAFAMIKTSNQNHPGFAAVHNIGDEAFFHTDHSNFCFIIARRGTQILRMKVNKLTAMTSLEKFRAIAGRISENM